MWLLRIHRPSRSLQWPPSPSFTTEGTSLVVPRTQVVSAPKLLLVRHGGELPWFGKRFEIATHASLGLENDPL
jgi:hypothetical protein